MDRDRSNEGGQRECPDAGGPAARALSLATFSFQPNQQTEQNSDREIKPR
jgi:hypothetical protein